MGFLVYLLALLLSPVVLLLPFALLGVGWFVGGGAVYGVAVLGCVVRDKIYLWDS